MYLILGFSFYFFNARILIRDIEGEIEIEIEEEKITKTNRYFFHRMCKRRQPVAFLVTHLYVT